jgi:capsular exopolysaccharide synthesis family protein
LDSVSEAAEAYRAIRTAVFLGAPGQKAKTVLVTSPLPGDGKTTLVSNLGIAMAQVGLRILILDADFRKPMQHNIFEINLNGMDMSSVLSGKATLEETVQRTEFEGLHVLCCRPGIPNPSELLHSKKLAKTLEQLSAQYDHIIIDSPPVTTVTDAQILAATCDVTLLVISSKTTRKTSQQARDGLLSVGACILGTVVNDVGSRSRYLH